MKGRGAFVEAEVGGSVWLDLSEMGAEGDAEVTYIGRCPEIEPDEANGHRPVVTGRFIHSSADNLVALHIKGESASTRVTENHLYWSIDRHTFVPAGELRMGERLDAADGRTARVASLSRPSGEEQVFNLEVNGEHVYRVGEAGVLVHNAYGIAGSGPLHHIVSWYSNAKRFTWTRDAQKILTRAKITTRSSGLNKVYLPGHKGPHPELYHQRVYERPRDAVAGLNPRTKKYAKEVTNELERIATDLLNDPTKLSGVGL